MQPGIRFVAVCTLFVSCASLPLGALARRQHQALSRGDWLEAVQLGRARVTQAPRDIGARYDLACALARAGDTTAALTTLHETIALGFDDLGWLERDDDLAPLRADPRFAQVKTDIRALILEGVHVEGVRTLVQPSLPMPVRLRLPLSPGRPRLAIWLHPSGARLNHVIEPLAPLLLSHGYALVVPMEVRPEGWSGREIATLLDDTVPRLAEWVDVEHPLLIGFSAGAEAALIAWERTPARFSGLLVAGAPAELFGGVRHRPAAPEARPLPVANAAPVIFSFGSLEPVLADWQALWPAWHERGLTFTVQLIANKHHEWLFEPAVLETQLTWLELVKASPSQ